MPNAPVCHVSTDQGIIEQPQAVLLPSIPTAVDLKSALAAINALKLIVQLLSGQQPFTGAAGVNGFAGLRGAAGAAGSSGTPGKAGQTGKKGKDGKTARYTEDRGQRVVKSITITSDDGESTVSFDRVDRVVWVDQVTSEQIVWSR